MKKREFALDFLFKSLQIVGKWEKEWIDSKFIGIFTDVIIPYCALVQWKLFYQSECRLNRVNQREKKTDIFTSCRIVISFTIRKKAESKYNSYWKWWTFSLCVCSNQFTKLIGVGRPIPPYEYKVAQKRHENKKRERKSRSSENFSFSIVCGIAMSLFSSGIGLQIAENMLCEPKATFLLSWCQMNVVIL